MDTLLPSGRSLRLTLRTVPLPRACVHPPTDRRRTDFSTCADAGEGRIAGGSPIRTQGPCPFDQRRAQRWAKRQVIQKL